MGIPSANQTTRGAFKVVVPVQKISHAQMEQKKKKSYATIMILSGMLGISVQILGFL
jgi:hypothetical protein